MKIKEGFVLKDMAGQYVAVPFGDKAVDFNGIVTLNETAKFLWEKCENEIEKSELVNALIETYEITVDIAENAVNTFETQMKEAGCLE